MDSPAAADTTSPDVPTTRRERRREARERKLESRLSKVYERRRNNRYLVVHDTSGPKVRLGILWVAALLGALAIGVVPLGVLLAVVAGFAAYQTAKAWEVHGERPQPVVAAIAAGGVPAAATISTEIAGFWVLAIPVISLLPALASRRTPTAPTEPSAPDQPTTDDPPTADRSTTDQSTTDQSTTDHGGVIDLRDDSEARLPERGGASGFSHPAPIAAQHGRSSGSLGLDIELDVELRIDADAAPEPELFAETVSHQEPQPEAEAADERLPMRSVAYTLQAALFTGFAAATPVLAMRVEIGAAVVLVLMIAIYDAGDFLVGSGAGHPAEGPVAGILGVVVIAFGVWVADPPPFVGAAPWLFGAAIAVFAPAGQLAGSLILPRARASAPALRRLDTLLVAGPLWMLLLWNYV